MLNHERKRFPNFGKDLAEKTSKVNMKVFLVSLIVYSVLPTPYFFNAILNPCLPTYAGSFELLDQCDAQALGMPPETVNYQLGKKLVVSVMEFLQWQFLVPGLAANLCLVSVQGLAFASYVRNYGK